MAINLGTRQEDIVTVVFFIPSFTWTKGVPLPVPYPIVKDTLERGQDVSDNVRYNKKWAYTKDSYTKKVYFDEPGLKEGGFFSLTRSKKTEPTRYSDSVFVNGRNAVRGADVAYMNNKNTLGFHVIMPPTSKPDITDSGKVAEAEAAPEIPSFMEFF